MICAYAFSYVVFVTSLIDCLGRTTILIITSRLLELHFSSFRTSRNRQVENSPRADSPEVAEAEACLKLSKSFNDVDGNCNFRCFLFWSMWFSNGSIMSIRRQFFNCG